jgi:hypothetical protein
LVAWDLVADAGFDGAVVDRASRSIVALKEIAMRGE